MAKNNKQHTTRAQGSKMDELFYFPTFDLLIKIVYAVEANSIRYATHRSIKTNEKKVVERYILQEIAPKTEYYTRHPSLLLYMGIDQSLKKELKTYQVKDTIKTIIDRKHNIDEKVQNLISSSLSALSHTWISSITPLNFCPVFPHEPTIVLPDVPLNAIPAFPASSATCSPLT